MYFDNKNINKMDPRLRAKLKIPVNKKPIDEVDKLKEKVKQMEVQLEKANESKNNLENIEPTKVKKTEKNDIEKINLEISNIKKEVKEIKLQVNEVKLQVNEIVNIIQSIMAINK